MTIKKTAKTPAKKAAAKTPAKKPAAHKKTSRPVVKKPAAPESVPAPVPVVPIGTNLPQEPAAPAVTEAGSNLSQGALDNLSRLHEETQEETLGGEPQPGQPTPEEIAQAEAAAVQARIMAEMGATLVVSTAEKAAVNFYHPAAQFPEPMKAGVIQDMAAVLAKYTGGGGVMPEWFVKYILPWLEELKLASKLGVLVYTVIGNVNKAKAEEAAKAAAEEEAKRQQQGQFAGAQG